MCVPSSFPYIKDVWDADAACYFSVGLEVLWDPVSRILARSLLVFQWSFNEKYARHILSPETVAILVLKHFFWRLFLRCNWRQNKYLCESETRMPKMTKLDNHEPELSDWKSECFWCLEKHSRLHSSVFDLFFQHIIGSVSNEMAWGFDKIQEQSKR